MPTLAFMPFNFGFNDMFGNINLNFRSFLNDEILSEIIRRSEMERGRMGTPPASKNEIDKLPEV